jgi:hypothetical protein
MLLRAFGILILLTGAAAAQAPTTERASRNLSRDTRTDRAREAARVPAERASRSPTRYTQADRARGPAQSPAERASRGLERDMRGDRFRDAAQDARGRDTPTRPEIQQFEPQRQTLRPDVGRPEQDGRLSTTGTPGGQLPSMGPNPQR